MLRLSYIKTVDSGSMITILLAILCVLAGLDLWRQYAINNNDFWFYHYTVGMKSSQTYWKLGFRLEDLESKISEQKARVYDIRKHFSSVSFPFRGQSQRFQHNRILRNSLHSLLRNDSSVYQISCESDGKLLRVGQNDYRTDPRDACQIFTSSSDSTKDGPHAMFEAVPFADGSIGLKSLANSMFMRTVPPPPESSSLPWKLVTGGPSPGSAEKFFVTDDGYLYSPLMGKGHHHRCCLSSLVYDTLYS